MSRSPEGYGSGASGLIHLAAKGVEKTTNDLSLSLLTYRTGFGGLRLVVASFLSTVTHRGQYDTPVLSQPFSRVRNHLFYTRDKVNKIQSWGRLSGEEGSGMEVRLGVGLGLGIIIEASQTIPIDHIGTMLMRRRRSIRYIITTVYSSTSSTEI